MWEGRAPSRPFRKRRCCAYADLAKADGTTTPGIPGYATSGLCQDAGGSRLSRPGESGGCPRARSTRTALGAWHCGVAGVWPRGNATLPYRTPLEPTPPLSPTVSPVSTTEHTERPAAVTEYTEEGSWAYRGLAFRVFRVPRSGFSVFSGETEGRRSNVPRRGGAGTSRARPSANLPAPTFKAAQRRFNPSWDALPRDRYLSLPSATRCPRARRTRRSRPSWSRRSPRARCPRAALGAWRCGVDGNNGWSRILAKTDCGVARYSGRRSHIGLCQNCVCEASAFPRRVQTRRSAPLPWAGCPANGRDGARPSRWGLIAVGTLATTRSTI